MAVEWLIGREIRLTGRSLFEIAPRHLVLVEAAVPRARPGQVLVRNTWMSVDPWLWGARQPNAPVRPGAALCGPALGYVIDSLAAGIPVGATVSHCSGWRDYAVVDARDAVVLDTRLAPAPAYLGVLGAPGLTAYAALTHLAPLQSTDVVLISAAAGAVGSIAGQLAHQSGAATVIGSASGRDQAEVLVTEFGYHHAIDNSSESLSTRLAELAPGGIDYYLDTADGGDLETVLRALRPRGRIVTTGRFRTLEPDDLHRLDAKDAALLRMRGRSYRHLYPDWLRRAVGRLAEGTLSAEQTVVTGLDQAPAALRTVLHTANTGPMLVHLP